MQVIEAPCPNGMLADREPQVSANSFAQNPAPLESKEPSDTSLSSQKVPLKSSEGSMMNHEDTLEVQEIYLKQHKHIMKLHLKKAALRKWVVFFVRTLRSCRMKRRR